MKTIKLENHVFVTKLAGFEYTSHISENQVTDKSDIYNIPLVQGQNIKDNLFVEKFNYFITEELSKDLNRSRLTKDCLLIPYVGSNLGEIGVFRHKYDCHLASNLAKIELTSNRFDLDFLKYFFMSDLGQKYLFKDKQGSAQPNITMQSIREVEVIDITIEEQRKISKILLAYDEKIAINNLSVDKLYESLNLIYSYWFNQFNFPNENNEPYNLYGGKMVWNESLRRKIPLGWKVQSLLNNEISKIVGGGVKPFDGKKEYLATADIDDTGALEGELLSYDERPNRANMSPIKNSVWVAKMADSPKRLFFTDESNLLDQYIISTGMFAFTSNKEHYEYLMMYLFSDHFERLKDRFAQGATQRAINQANLALFPIIIPDKNILKQFHNLTKDMVREIELLKEENQELKKQRDFLLPLLMNGQVKIK